jgi:SAM-dependent methyltransferase
MVTTICFLEDLNQTLREASRILEPGGYVLIGYIDKESDVGEQYQSIKEENPFYRHATFHYTTDIVSALEKVGFESHEFRQTIFSVPEKGSNSIDPITQGHGEGSFVALRSQLTE